MLLIAIILCFIVTLMIVIVFALLRVSNALQSIAETSAELASDAATRTLRETFS